MIPLRVEIEPFLTDTPIVARLKMSSFDDAQSDLGRDAVFQRQGGGIANFSLSGEVLKVKTTKPQKLDGDVILILPGRKSIHRLIRRDSNHNTFLITEQCDQLCVMCSQPPKKGHLDLFGSSPLC